MYSQTCIQRVPITTDVVSLNLDQRKVYNIIQLLTFVEINILGSIVPRYIKFAEAEAEVNIIYLGTNSSLY
jgi:hypothetical protein